jgi:DNA polymerase I-like protein with 3'-5' exonuclease and polymerase domains/uracil-DNA glycosylase
VIFGNTKNPKAIVILNSPELEDESPEGRLRGPKGSILAQAIDPEQFAVAFMVPHVLFADEVRNEGYRRPTDEEVERHLPDLIAEITKIDCGTLIPLGSTLVRQFVDPEALIAKAVGKKVDREYNGRKYKVIPNFDPGQVAIKPKIEGEFKAIFANVLADKGTDEGPQWAILDYEGAIRELKRILKLYASGEIEYIIYDSETTSLTPHTGELIMYSWAHDADERAFCVPLRVNNTVPDKEVFNDFKIVDADELYEAGSLTSDIWDHTKNPFKIPKVNIEIDAGQAAKINYLVQKVLETVPIVGHNLKFDVKYGHYHGVCDLRKVRILDDTNLMGFQVFGKGFAGWLSLKGMSQRYCGAQNWDGIQDDFLSRFRLEKDRNFGNIPTGMLGVYACLDAYWNKQLYKYMRRVLRESMVPVTRLVTDMIRPFAEAEVKGVPIDMEMKARLEQAYGEISERTEREIYSLPKVSAYRQMDYDKLYAKKAAELKKSKPNPDKIWEQVLKLKNPDKVGDLMYGEGFYNLPPQEDFMTAGGKSGNSKPQTGKDARNHFIENMLNDATLKELETAGLEPERIAELREAKRFLELMNQFSRMEKLLSVYLGDNLMESCEGHFLKPDFSLTGTLGGRLSSGFHTIDSWSDIKRLYVSRWRGKGGVVLAPDFSQLELRIAASISGDPSLIEAYVKGIDIHKMTASKIFGVPVEQVTKDHRKVGKTVNFAILYGKTAHGLSLELGVSPERAEEMIENFFEGFPYLRDHFAAAKREILKTGHVTTAWGRRIPIEDWDSKNKGKLNAAIRSGSNATIQSPASDCVLWTIRENYKRLCELETKSFMFASVHDSIEYDAAPGELFTVLKGVKEIAEQRMPVDIPWVKCPIELGVEMGVSWGGGVEFHIHELSDTHFVGEGKGLRCDVDDLVAELSLAYDVETETIGEDKPEKNLNDIAYIVRDDKERKFKMTLRAKSVAEPVAS